MPKKEFIRFVTDNRVRLPAGSVALLEAWGSVAHDWNWTNETTVAGSTSSSSCSSSCNCAVNKKNSLRAKSCPGTQNLNEYFLPNQRTNNQLKRAPRAKKRRSRSTPGPAIKTETSSLLSNKLACEKSVLEMHSDEQEVQFRNEATYMPKHNIYNVLRLVFERNIAPSVRVQINKTCTDCHMLVLQCFSDFFMECGNAHMVVLPHTFVTPHAFHMLYVWMLSGTPYFTQEFILDMFKAANFLRMRDIVEQCWSYLNDAVRFNEDNAFIMYLGARKLKLKHVAELMLSRIGKFFITLVASKDFLALTANEVYALLDSNAIAVNSETEVLFALVRWLNYRWEQRRKLLLKLARAVRFGLLPPWYLFALQRCTGVLEVDRVVGNEDVRQLISDSILFSMRRTEHNAFRDKVLQSLNLPDTPQPHERMWISDKSMEKLNSEPCSNMTYVSFLEYLDIVRSRGRGYWKTLDYVLAHAPKPDKLSSLQLRAPDNDFSVNEEIQIRRSDIDCLRFGNKRTVHDYDNVYKCDNNDDDDDDNDDNDHNDDNDDNDVDVVVDVDADDVDKDTYKTFGSNKAHHSKKKLECTNTKKYSFTPL